VIRVGNGLDEDKGWVKSRPFLVSNLGAEEPVRGHSQCSRVCYRAIVSTPGKRRLLPGLSVEDGFMRHPFDIANGVRTSGLVAGRYLKSGHLHDRHATAYYGVAPSVFRSLVRRWRLTKPTAPIDEFTFIDIGAGMGRAALLASEMPFHEIVGVELNPTLARIARRNLAIWRSKMRACAPVRISCCDATEFTFPAGPCLVFLFNPFGATVMRRLLKRIATSFAGRMDAVDLIYVNNEQEAEFERHRGFRRLFLGKVYRSGADAKADRAILISQPDGEYAFEKHEACSIWRWAG
jgi:predicted RNA methylase